MPRALGLGGIPAGPYGVFAGNAPDPSDPTAAIVRETLDSMTGDPGLRLGRGRGARNFRGGGPSPQVFVGASSPASDEALEVIPITAGTRSRAMGQFRGTPGMSWPTTGLGDDA